MDRFTAKKFLPIIEAYCDGKDIEYFFPLEGWRTYVNPKFEGSPSDYRIKPTPTYRPFANAKECWQEMLQHEPFGWLKDKEDGHYASIRSVDKGVFFSTVDKGWNYSGILRCYTFADGTPFGKQTEEE